MATDGEFAFIVHTPGLDFSVIEQHILAAMYHETAKGSIFIDLESRGGEIAPVNHQLSLYAQGMQLAESFEKPVKQNGRSADYLRHDPTKKHGRRRG